jgi:hypothetical protein
VIGFAAFVCILCGAVGCAFGHGNDAGGLLFVGLILAVVADC